MLKVTLTFMLPVFVFVLCMYSMPGEPLTCSSMGMATVCCNVCVSAPVYDPVMDTEGGEIFGYWSTARLKMHIAPEMTSTIDITIAVTGLFMNVLAIILEQVGFDRPADPFRAGRGIFEFRIPVRDRCSALPPSWPFPSALHDAPGDIPASSFHKKHG